MSWLRRCAELQQPANFESSLFTSGQLVDVITVVTAAICVALGRLACARTVRSMIAVCSRKPLECYQPVLRLSFEFECRVWRVRDRQLPLFEVIWHGVNVPGVC